MTYLAESVVCRTVYSSGFEDIYNIDDIDNHYHELF